MNNLNIGVLGVGYVGLPLVKSLSKNFKIVAYDPNKKRINSLKKKKDINNEEVLKKILKMLNLLMKVTI